MSINYDISANIIYQLHHLEYGELVYKVILSVFQIRKLYCYQVVKHLQAKKQAECH